MISRGRRAANIERTVAELKTILRDIILEVGELKERVVRLEAAAAQRDKDVNQDHGVSGLYADRGGETADLANLPTEADLASSSGLQQFYLEGRHICPMAYGQERNEGCLFCAALLARSDSQ